ncbi:uncharacterized protein LOC122850970 [Aphidius gifuensis]|uniref:uncharacterized protein LOC122850970 n=1 Tax=Aphidius gifuensis TaxID=684658 RepID=UPI001CDC08B5|nr:uncharacterized protein LOC122850970 [Aphidius gifuensis]
MTKVSSIKNGKHTKKIPPPIDVKVRTKKRKKRKDLEQIRQSVLDARQDLRRERRLAGALKYKGPSNVLDKTLRDFADIREENENKTQGISNKGENKNERILCTRLLHEPTIGLFKKGAKGNEVKRRVDVTLSDAADARLRGDVIRLLNGDNTSPRNNDNNERKIIQEEKIISKQVKPVHANLEESEKTPSPVLLHRTNWISKDENAKNLKKKDDNNRRLFEIDDDDDDDNDDSNINKDLPAMDSLEFSPKASRVDESDSIDGPNDLNKHKKLPKLNDCSSSLNRWRWSPATCFEEYCSIVCVGTFTNFIDNCTVEDPVERIRNELMATYKEVRGQQKNDDNHYANKEFECTPQFSDSSTVTCEVVGHHGSHNKVISKSSTNSSLATTVLTDDKNDVIEVPELKHYFKNLDSKVTPQNKMVKQNDGRIVRVSLQQPFRTPRNSLDLLTSIDMTRNKNDKYSKKNTERLNHVPFQEKVYHDKKKEFHRIYLPEQTSLNIQENEFNNNFIEKKNNFDAVSEYSIDKGYDQDLTSPSLGWSASHEAKLVQLPPSYSKHIPTILRRSTNNKTVHFNLDLTNHQRRIKNNYVNTPDNNLSNNYETEYNDAILRGFKVLSCSEVERSKAKFNERGKISGHFLSNQPAKYLAMSEENDKSLVPRRVPVYHNVEKIDNKNLNDTLAYSDIYKKSNRVLTPPLGKIYPQKHQSISFDHSVLLNTNLHNDKNYLHRDLFSQEHLKKIQHRQRLYGIDHVDRQHKAQALNYFAPINSYEESSREVKCFENLCDKKNCHECFQARLKNTIRKI